MTAGGRCSTFNGTAAAAGAVLAIGGIVLCVVAQFAMGDSWRIGVDTSARTELVTTFGIMLAVLSLIVMPTLAVAKRRVATQLGSLTLRADAAETMLCSWLSAALLGGLLVDATVGWWWADPVAALVIAALGAKEGIEAWQRDSCVDACEP